MRDHAGDSRLELEAACTDGRIGWKDQAALTKVLSNVDQIVNSGLCWIVQSKRKNGGIMVCLN